MTSFSGIPHPSTILIPDRPSISPQGTDPPSKECLILPVVSSTPLGIGRIVHGSQPLP